MRAGRKHHVHGPGVAYISVTLLLGIGAVNSQNSLLFLIFGAALGGVLVSGVLSGAMLMGLDVERHGPVRLTVDQPASHLYVVRNRNGWIPAFAVRIREVDRTRKRAGLRGWTGRLAPADAFAAYVPPRGSAHVEAPVRPLRRGAVQLRRFVAWSTFPFGVAKKSIIFEQPEEVLIRPRALTLRLDWDAVAANPAGEGSASGVKVGQGEEFFSLREHREGDSPRVIAWRPSAKLDRLLVREHAAPTPGKVWIAINFNATGSPAEVDEASERAISIAAGLLDDARAHGMSPGLLAPVCGVSLEPAASRLDLRRGDMRGEALDALAELEPPATPNPAIAPHRPGPVVAVHAGAVEHRFATTAAAHVSASEAGGRATSRAHAESFTGGAPAEAVA